MPILINKEILSLVSRNELILDADRSLVQPCSYDMRIGSIFRDGQVIDATHARSNEQISLAPGEIITMTTLERLELPADIAGTAYAINAQSSEGLLVLNPGHVDPGYKGTLTVMAVNLRRVPYVVSRKDKIFTVVFHRLDLAAEPSYANRPGNTNDRERDLNKKVVEKGVSSLGDLIALTPNAPFTRPSDVDERIKGHWATIATITIAGLTFLTSIVAAVFAVAALLKDPPATRSEVTATRTSEALPSQSCPLAACTSNSGTLQPIPAQPNPSQHGSSMDKQLKARSEDHPDQVQTTGPAVPIRDVPGGDASTHER